jgi:hypothetical protein
MVGRRNSGETLAGNAVCFAQRREAWLYGCAMHFVAGLTHDLLGEARDVGMIEAALKQLIETIYKPSLRKEGIMGQCIAYGAFDFLLKCIWIACHKGFRGIGRL